MPVFKRRGRLLRPATTVFRKVPFDEALLDQVNVLKPSKSEPNFGDDTEFIQLPLAKRIQVLTKLDNSVDITDNNRYRDLKTLHDAKIVK